MNLTREEMQYLTWVLERIPYHRNHALEQAILAKLNERATFKNTVPEPA